MAQFEQEPVLILQTMEEVREAAKIDRGDYSQQNKGKGLDHWRIKSVWLISLIDEITASGQYPYNAVVKALALKRLGTEGDADTENDTLSLLVYNAQKYRRHDMLVAEGFVPFTPELLREAYENGKLVELRGENFIGGEVNARYIPKIVGGQLYAMVPKKRKYHVQPNGQPVRLVKPESKAKDSNDSGGSLFVVSA